jgi:CRP-like cAMP-binding protein
MDTTSLSDLKIFLIESFFQQVEMKDNITGSAQYDIIRKKEIFGEENLFHEVHCEVHIRAKTHVDLFTLSKADFDEVLDNFPELKVQVNEHAHERFDIPLQPQNGR